MKPTLSKYIKNQILANGVIGNAVFCDVTENSAKVRFNGIRVEPTKGNLRIVFMLDKNDMFYLEASNIMPTDNVTVQGDNCIAGTFQFSFDFR